MDAMIYLDVCVYMCARVPVCMCVRTCVHVCMYTCGNMHVCMHKYQLTCNCIFCLSISFINNSL